MASTATAGCKPSSCNRIKPHSSSCNERGITSTRRNSSAGQLHPQSVRLTTSAERTPPITPSNKLNSHDQRATATVTAIPLSDAAIKAGSVLG